MGRGLMSSWQEAVKKLFATHPRAISAKTVIEAINLQAPETFTLSARDLASEQNRSWNLGHDRGQQDERERIIRLLKDELWKLPNGMPAGGKTYLSIEEAIALIKGENK